MPWKLYCVADNPEQNVICHLQTLFVSVPLDYLQLTTQRFALFKFGSYFYILGKINGLLIIKLEVSYLLCQQQCNQLCNCKGFQWINFQFGQREGAQLAAFSRLSHREV